MNGLMIGIVIAGIFGIFILYKYSEKLNLEKILNSMERG